ncbi:MAG TPA: permease-like cell division protein FtsX [Longimicrobiales bacterium]|nr:permease-like cell division protein FtsX [Longimicrobiales bacterium]
MYALREALAAFRRTPVLTVLSAAMIGLSLCVVGIFAVTAHNVREVLDRVESRVEIVAYLRDDATEQQVQDARAQILALPEVREVLYVSRAQALEIAKQELSDISSIFSDLDVNPLPASLEISLVPGQKGPDVVTAVAARVSSYSFVEDVRYGREWLDKVYLLRRVAGAAALVVGGAFALVAALIIGAAVRMAIFARRDEIAIMRLVGATHGFIRRPFLFEGFFTGLLGALLALPAVYIIFRVLSDAIFHLDWIPPLWVLGGFVIGGVLGIIASWSAVRQHLREL